MSANSTVLVVSAVAEERERWRERLAREGGPPAECFRSLAEALASLPHRFEAAIVELPLVHPVILPWLGRLHARQPSAVLVVRVPSPDEETTRALVDAGCSAVLSRDESLERTVDFLRSALRPPSARRNA